MNNATEIIGKQVLRSAILVIVDGAEPLGAGTDVIHPLLRQGGYAADKNDVAIACNYLEGKGLVRMERIENKVLGITRHIAHITPKGVDVLEGTVTVEGVGLPG